MFVYQTLTLFILLWITLLPLEAPDPCLLLLSLEHTYIPHLAFLSLEFFIFTWLHNRFGFLLLSICFISFQLPAKKSKRVKRGNFHSPDSCFSKENFCKSCSNFNIKWKKWLELFFGEKKKILSSVQMCAHTFQSQETLRVVLDKMTQRKFWKFLEY